MMLQYLDTIIAFAVIMLGISLLITILTQMISAFLGYRGTNLLWGLKTLLGTIEPKLETQAETLAKEVLQAPLISDSIFSKFTDIPLIGKLMQRWKLPSAITADEFARRLGELVNSKDVDTAGLIKSALRGLDPEATRKVQMVQTALAGLGSNYTVQIDKAVHQLGASMQASIGKIEAGFDVVMKRVSQRFTTQMRIWTIIFAVIISFAAGLDSFKIFNKLWTSPALRANLAGQTETFLKEASTILGGETGTALSAAPGVSPQILTDALKRLKNEEKESMKGLPEAPKFKDMNGAIDWLRSNLKADKARENLVNKYQALVFDELKKHADTIQRGLAKAEFRLQIPVSCKDFKNLSIWGILTTAAFLSLGGPFWFSALKTLTNLKPLAAAMTKTAPGSSQS